MKTPEREDARPIDEPVYDCMGGICDITNDWGPVHVAHARWKRKNRIKQLKRTIERLRRENLYMKIDLRIPLNISYDEYHSRRVDFTEKQPEPTTTLTD